MRIPLFAAVLAIAPLACGKSPPPESPSSELPSAAPTAAAPLTTISLTRSGVKRTIAKGLGYFLQEIAVEDYPVMNGGKFHGFKIKAITREWGVDLRPGDVVTRVNGMGIEHPEDADAALHSLDKAKSLKVDFDRDGKPLSLELPIVDD